MQINSHNLKLQKTHQLQKQNAEIRDVEFTHESLTNIKFLDADNIKISNSKNNIKIINDEFK